MIQEKNRLYYFTFSGPLEVATTEVPDYKCQDDCVILVRGTVLEATFWLISSHTFLVSLPKHVFLMYCCHGWLAMTDCSISPQI